MKAAAPPACANMPVPPANGYIPVKLISPVVMSKPVVMKLPFGANS